GGGNREVNGVVATVLLRERGRAVLLGDARGQRPAQRGGQAAGIGEEVVVRALGVLDDLGLGQARLGGGRVELGEGADEVLTGGGRAVGGGGHGCSRTGDAAVPRRW